MTTESQVIEVLRQALPRIDTALDQLAALTERLDDAPTTPISWPTLTVDEAATVWAQLADWTAATATPGSGPGCCSTPATPTASARRRMRSMCSSGPR